MERISQSAIWVWRRISDLSTAAWLWPGGAVVITAALSLIEGLPWALLFIFCVAVGVFSLIGVMLYQNHNSGENARRSDPPLKEPLGKARTTVKSEQPPPNLPIDIASLGAYVRGFPRVRRMGTKIAKKLGRPVPQPFKMASASHVEQALAVGLSTIAELDQALAHDETLVERMAAYWVPQEDLEIDFALTCLFFVIGGRMGGDAYYERVKDLKFHSTSLGTCNEVARIYGQITAY